MTRARLTRVIHLQDYQRSGHWYLLVPGVCLSRRALACKYPWAHRGYPAIGN